MQLKVLLPTKILLDMKVEKVVADTGEGSHGILPKHIDFVSTVVPGLLAYVPEGGGGEEFLAVDAGILVKQGEEVLVSVRNGVKGKQLGELRQAVEDLFHNRSEEEKRAQSVLAKLETDFARRFMEIRE